MKASNPTVGLCVQCGAPLPADAPKGVCPQCELQGALGLLGAGSEATKIEATGAEEATYSPPRRFGNYELLEEIARGGMGVVYKARQRGLDRIVAVKMILVEQFAGKQSVQRFRGEAAAAGVLRHPNIVAIHEIGMHEGQHFFSMDYVEGQNLAQLVGHLPLPASRAARYVQLIAEAVHYAHEQGILHRDLKPSNVLIDAATDQPRITDFGLAKRLADSQLSTLNSPPTLSGQLLGSPNFMPPEQASRSRGKVGRPSDVFGLGGILYFLLTARAPFPGESLETTIGQVLNSDPVPPRLFNPNVPRDLETICLKCLEKESARRYATAQELADELGRFLADKPILARPVSQPEKIWRWCRRNPVAAALATMAVFVFLFGFAGVAWQGHRASKARDLAQGRLYESLVREARATRAARRVGYRDEVFTLLQQARALNVRQKDLTELRREAVACLGDFVGLTPTTFSDFPSNTTIGVVHMDPSWSFAAFSLSDGTLLLRQMPSGTEVARLQMDYPAWRHCFNASGDQLASVHVPAGTAPLRELLQRSVVCVWSRTIDGRWHQVERTPMPGAYECFASDRQFFVAVDDATAPAVRLIELKGKTAVLTVPLPPEMQKWAAVAFSPDGKFLIVETVEPKEPSISVLDIWDWAAGRRMHRLEPRVSGVSPIIFSRDGKYFCCVSDESVVIYKMDGFQRVSEFREWSRLGSRPAFAPDSDVIAVPIWQQRRIRLWDFLRNQDIAVLDEPFYAGGVRFAPDGSFLLTIGPRHTRLYRLDLSAEVLCLPGHVGGVPGVCFSPDGSRLASAGKDRTVRVWEAATGHVVWAKDLPGRGQCVTYSPDGRWLVTGDYDKRMVWVWDAQSGKRLLELGTNVNGIVWSAQFAPDGRYLAIAGAGGGPGSAEVTVWAIEPNTTGGLEAGLAARPLRSFSGGDCWSLVFSPDSRRIAFVDRARGNDLLVWNISGADKPRRLATNITWSVQSVSFKPDGRQLVYLGADGVVVTLDTATGAQTASFSTMSARQSRLPGLMNLSLSPDGTRLAVVSASSLSVDIWDPKAGRLFYSLPEQEGTVWWLAWAPDNHRLAVSRSNGDIAVWNLMEVERVLTKLGLDAGEAGPRTVPVRRRSEDARDLNPSRSVLR